MIYEKGRNKREIRGVSGNLTILAMFYALKEK